jgi:hypothetical protein
MKNREAFLEQQLRAAHQFIRAEMARAKDYGSQFSSDLYCDCEVFFRDNPPPKNSTHVVITRTYLTRLQAKAIEALKLKAAARKAQL